jgi:hypothetical protein
MNLRRHSLNLTSAPTHVDKAGMVEGRINLMAWCKLSLEREQSKVKGPFLRHQARRGRPTDKVAKLFGLIRLMRGQEWQKVYRAISDTIDCIEIFDRL